LGDVELGQVNRRHPTFDVADDQLTGSCECGRGGQVAANAREHGCVGVQIWSIRGLFGERLTYQRAGPARFTLARQELR
jgi:hypothetical protein